MAIGEPTLTKFYEDMELNLELVNGQARSSCWRIVEEAKERAANKSGQCQDEDAQVQHQHRQHAIKTGEMTVSSNSLHTRKTCESQQQQQPVE